MTKEQVRARYFAAHLGCEVAHPRITPYSCKLYGVRHDYLMLLTQKFEKYIPQVDEVSDCKVIIRPLSAITDEHAVMVAKVLFTFDVNPFVLVKDNSGVTKLVNEEWTFIINNHLNRYDDLIQLLSAKCKQSMGHGVVVESTDLLRSLGYHTGIFMGFCPIQEGWAVLTDKNDKV